MSNHRQTRFVPTQSQIVQVFGLTRANRSTFRFKTLTTSLLFFVGLAPQCPNPSLWKEGEMHVLAALSAVRAPKQLSLFDPLVVSLEVVEQDIQTPADQRSGAVAVVGQVSNLLQLVDVRLSQSQCDFLNNRLHGRMSSVHHEGTQQTCEISANGTGTQTGKQGAHFEVRSSLPPQSEDYLKVTVPRLPLDFILGPKRAKELSEGEKLTERICARLVQLEAHESNNSLRSDYRQAFICTSLAGKGNKQAFLESSYAVHGIHQDKVWPRILNNRKERLGKEYYQFFDSNDVARPDVRWNDSIVYDLPSSGPADRQLGASAGAHQYGVGPDSSLAATRAASPSTAAKGGDGPDPAGRDSSPLPPTKVPNVKERLA